MLASSGLATPPCGVPRVFPLPPLMRRVPSASRSSIGALSHILMRRRTFRSTTRRATDFISSEVAVRPTLVRRDDLVKQHGLLVLLGEAGLPHSSGPIVHNLRRGKCAYEGHKRLDP